MMKRIITTLGLLGVMTGALANVSTNNKKDRQRLQDRKLFSQMYYAALNGEKARVSQNRSKLQHYPLSHYLDYALIRHDINKLPEKAIADFKSKHPKSPLNSRLKKALVNAMGQQKAWDKYLKYHNGIGTGKQQCWYLNARVGTKKTKNLAPLIEAMWLSGLSAPDACDAAFNWWKKQGHMTEDLILKRVKLAYEKRNFSLMTYLKKELKNPPKWIDRGIELLKTPEHGLRQATSWSSDPETVWLINRAALRMAQKQPMTFQSMWGDLQKAHTFTTAQKQQIERKNALFAATDYETWSIGAMESLPAAVKDDQIKAWIVRYYLYKQNWPKVLSSLRDMSLFQISKDNWQYWLGRAKAKNGDAAGAKKHFTELSKKTNYYGFLAADHLRMPYALCHQSNVSANQSYKASAGIERAIELHHLGMLWMARSEWNVSYKGLSRPDKQALSDRVIAEGWYAKSIAIMADMGQWNNYSLRYPIAHQKTIEQFSKNSPVLPQWVMAIIKQESAWAKDAVSHADAHGLMQLIPPTAKRLSQQLGLTYTDTNQLHQAEHNIRLGIHYQKNLFKRFDHPMLAAAAYNAGERKSDDWSVGFPSSPDMWLETIPYRETRDYVAKILSNVTIYDWLMNQQPKRISHWMPSMPVDNKPSLPWPAASVANKRAPIRACSP